MTDTRHLYRADAPETSIDAAKSIDCTELELMVLGAIRNFGRVGCISDEVLEVFPGYAYSSVTARYRALKDKGLIEIIGRRPGRSGRGQSIMRAKEGGA